MTPAEARLRASAAANARHSRTDGRTATAAAREAFMAKFENEVDPHRQLAPAERQRRAELARKAHMQSLALKSIKARRKKR